MDSSVNKVSYFSSLHMLFIPGIVSVERMQDNMRSVREYAAVYTIELKGLDRTLE